LEIVGRAFFRGRGQCYTTAVTARVFVKICGVMCVPDALHAVALGADAVGVNLVPTSKRRLSESAARDIARALHGKALTIAVVADLDAAELRRVASTTGVDRLQLHGDEPPDRVAALAPLAFKAVRIAAVAGVEGASEFGGDPILLDAFVPGALGGTGRLLDWSLAARLSAVRPVLLAGGLRPENVAAAVTAVRPWGVDVASGVEVNGKPGEKDWDAVQRFIEAARSA
jgi:phosphoribosylanthranilate isomerase